MSIGSSTLARLTDDALDHLRREFGKGMDERRAGAFAALLVAEEALRARAAIRAAVSLLDQGQRTEARQLLQAASTPDYLGDNLGNGLPDELSPETTRPPKP